jgi:ATP-binding cassette subfamily B multidrug efflux pump
MTHERDRDRDRDEERLGRIYDARLFRRLLGFVRPYRALAFGGLALVLLASALVVAGPLIIRRLIDLGIRGENAGIVASLAFAYLGVELLRFAVEYAQGYALQRLGQVSMRDLRMAVFRHLQKVPMSYFEENRVGRIVTRTTNDVASLTELFSVGLVTIFKDVILIAGISAVLLALNWRVALVTLSVAPLVAMAVWGFRRALRGAFRRVRAAVARLNATMQENIHGAGATQLLGIEADRIGRFRGDNDEFLAASISSTRAHAIFAPVISVASALALGLVFWHGGGEAIQGAITLGTLVAFIEYMPHLLTPIRDLGEKFTILQSAFAAAERVFGVLDTPPGIVDAPDAAPMPEARGELAFEGVRFGYAPGAEVLRGVSLRVRPGERVALVGRTGSGKTTLARLAVRFYDPWAGSIRLDGRELRDIPLADLRRHVAVVTQDVFIFGTTALENVRLGDRSIAPERAIEACRWTNADGFIARLPGGYDAPMAEGGRTISVGERQLLAFARALARRPAVLILDEATANVDTRTERTIVQAVDRITRGRTAIVIAHRLATVRSADRVVVIEDGRIVEEGPPAELLASERGFFRRLHALQFSGGET